MNEYDLVIVGAGMVGSALALSLKDQKIKILLVDSGSFDVQLINTSSSFEPRVSALSAASKYLLQKLDVWDSMVAQRVTPYTNMSVQDSVAGGFVEFNSTDAVAPELGHIVENRVVQNSLYLALKETNITLLSAARLEQMSRSGNRWLLRLSDGQILNTPLVIGADGARSSVRSMVGLQTREWNYLHQAIVTTVRCERPHEFCARQSFTQDGPLAFLPLASSDQSFCSIVWSTPPERAQQLMMLDDSIFCRELEHAFDSRLGVIKKTEQRFCIPLRQRHAKRYVEAGVAVIGDAAHSIHPLAGQGVNLGFLDVDVLANVLIKALNSHENIADLCVLNRYERKRMLNNLSMMASMEGLERLFQSKKWPVQLLRSAGLNKVNTILPIKKMFIKRALGLDQIVLNTVTV